MINVPIEYLYIVLSYISVALSTNGIKHGGSLLSKTDFSSEGGRFARGEGREFPDPAEAERGTRAGLHRQEEGSGGRGAGGGDGRHQAAQVVQDVRQTEDGRGADAGRRQGRGLHPPARGAGQGRRVLRLGEVPRPRPPLQAGGQQGLVLEKVPSEGS